MLDLFGTAILDYQTNNSPEDLITETNISEPDLMHVAYLFRDFEQMPLPEQKALQLAKGKILDAGCGAGSHSLYLQNIENKQVYSIDISENAIKTCKLRGLKNAKVADIMLFDNQQFDTILLLMNGTGICGTMKNLTAFLQKLKSLLEPNGQILMDSTDILYMFDANETAAIQKDKQYYGELRFQITYKNKIEKPFSWLYLDYETLKINAIANGFLIEKILETDSHSYLARLY
jgi:SAM-dependent methyltransferase